ncbi:MAG: hypothetical protein AABY47_00135 [Pseudomonadota bacterium]
MISIIKKFSFVVVVLWLDHRFSNPIQNYGYYSAAIGIRSQIKNTSEQLTRLIPDSRP